MVVGSGAEGVGDDYRTIEIYSQNDNLFQYGPRLPVGLEGAATVPYGDSIIVVGGFDDNCYCDSSRKN